MAGFRLTDGSSGCPPTETPPASYEIPFRFDDAGRLWLSTCFQGFRYFGAARWDLLESGLIIGDGGLVISATDDIISGVSVTAGSYVPINVVNDGECDMGFLLAPDLFVYMAGRSDNLIRWVASTRWNGVHHSTIGTSSLNKSGDVVHIRGEFNGSANPHDAGLEAAAPGPPYVPTLTLAPGASATVGVKIFIKYIVGSPSADETVYGAAAAVRVYGYNI